MALCSKLSTNEQREGDGKARGGTRGQQGGGKKSGGSMMRCNEYIRTNTAWSVPTEKHPITTPLGVLTGWRQMITCDLEMISLIAICLDMQQSAAVLHIHYTIPCINRSMEMHAFMCLQTTAVRYINHPGGKSNTTIVPWVSEHWGWGTRWWHRGCYVLTSTSMYSWEFVWGRWDEDTLNCTGRNEGTTVWIEP